MVSVRDGKRHVHDGPYAETKEFLGGFLVIDVPDLEPPWNGPPEALPPAMQRSRFVHFVRLNCHEDNFQPQGKYDESAFGLF